MILSGKRSPRSCDPLIQPDIQPEVERRVEEEGYETEVDLELKLWFVHGGYIHYQRLGYRKLFGRYASIIDKQHQYVPQFRSLADLSNH